MWLLFLFISHLEAKQVCAPTSGAASFSLNCKLVSEEEAKKMQAEILAKKTKNEKLALEKIKIGAYSGKAGYFAIVNEKNIDIVFMNIKSHNQALEIFDKSKLGETKLCTIEGFEQSIGYTVFSISSCE